MAKRKLRGIVFLSGFWTILIVLSFVISLQDKKIVSVIFFSTLVFSLLGGIYCALKWQKIEGRLNLWSLEGFLEAMGGVILGLLFLCFPMTLLSWLVPWPSPLGIYIVILTGIVGIIFFFCISNPSADVFSIGKGIVRILCVLMILSVFGMLNFYTHEYKFGIGAIPILIGKWQGNICYTAFCVERGTHSKTYGGVLGGKQTIRFCSEHIRDAPRSIGAYGYSLGNLVFSGGTIAAFIFLIIRIWVSVSDDFNPAENLLLLSFACLLVYIVPTIGAII